LRQLNCFDLFPHHWTKQIFVFEAVTRRTGQMLRRVGLVEGHRHLSADRYLQFPNGCGNLIQGSGNLH
jgi:hypothetical protein